MHMLIRFLGTVGAVLLAAYLVPGFTVEGLYAAAIVAILLGIIGFTLKPILMILTLPINIITFGLFSFVINAGILLFLASFVQGFDIQGFIPALIGGVVIAVVQWFTHQLA
jgi:putative membrane protein